MDMKHLIARSLLLAALLLSTASCKAEDKTQAQPTPPDPTPSGPESGELYVKVQGEDCYISAKLSAEKDIVYWFKKCLFNELYTFYRVGVVTNPAAAPTQKPEAAPELTLNLAFSDNIGPFSIRDGGWCGANHSYQEGNKVRTAANESFSIQVDGQPAGGSLARYADEVRIDVQNVIYNPTRPTDSGGETRLEEPLCRETVVYTIRRNSIEVAVSHRFENDVPVTVVAYYGMQSMFNEETHTLTSGGAFPDWSVLDNSRFTKQEYPDFRRFVEKNDRAYQSAFLLDEGLGDHSWIPAANTIFIGNSYGKNYHWLIANKAVSEGVRINWRGVYTWFTEPLADDTQLLCYEGVVGGRTALFIDCKSACERTMTLTDGYDLEGFELLDANGGVEVSDSGAQQLRIRAPKAGGCVIQLKGLSEIPITD